jgi:hypothetical protein
MCFPDEFLNILGMGTGCPINTGRRTTEEEKLNASYCFKKRIVPAS